MAHPARAHLVKTLPSDWPVAWEKGQGRWDTGKRAWLLADMSDPYHVVVQDDSILCANFERNLNLIFENLTDELPVSLYAGKALPRMVGNQRNKLGSAAWVEMRGLCWGVAVTVPTVLIPDMLAYGDTIQSDMYDLRLSRFFEHEGIPVRYTIPSLVDHRVGPSLVPGHGRRRQAYRFGKWKPGELISVNYAYPKGYKGTGRYKPKKR